MRMLSPLSTNWSRRDLSPDLMGDMFGDFDRMLDGFFRQSDMGAMSFNPSCDVHESKDHFLLSFDVPGVSKEDLKIEVEGNQLIVSGERRREIKEGDGETALRHERSYGKFARTFSLPTSIDAEKIQAHYENGVLKVALPKVEKAKGRTIEVQTGQSSFFNRLLGSKKDESKGLKDVKIS